MKLTERQISFVIIFFPAIIICAAWFSLSDKFHKIDIIMLITMYILTMLGITVGFHRLFTHKSFKCRKFFKIFLGILGCMAGQGPITFWVACHRQHHKNSDKENDPHSPNLFGENLKGQLQGLWHSHIGWMLNRKPHNYKSLIMDLLRDPTVIQIDRLYFLWLFMGMIIPGILSIIYTKSLFGFLSGIFWGGIVRIFLVHHSTWSINSLCHWRGSAPFETFDNSKNNLICALLTFGEGWHNNHHAFPNSARHGLNWWQFDLSFFIIKIFEYFNIIYDIKVPTDAQVLSRKRNEKTEVESN